MDDARALSTRGKLVALWGVMGVVFLLVEAIVRLAPLAWEPLADGSMSGLQWSLYVGWCGFNGYAEGYRGFQKSFAPRLVARAVYLGQQSWPVATLLAPAFCMAMFHAKRKNLIVAWALLLGIIFLVTAVRLLPQPWRGIVDAGVVVGLVWGSGSILVIFVRAMVNGRVPSDDSLPDDG